MQELSGLWAKKEVVCSTGERAGAAGHMGRKHGASAPAAAATAALGTAPAASTAATAPAGHMESSSVLAPTVKHVLLLPSAQPSLCSLGLPSPSPLPPGPFEPGNHSDWRLWRNSLPGAFPPAVGAGQQRGAAEGEDTFRAAAQRLQCSVRVVAARAKPAPCLADNLIRYLSPLPRPPRTADNQIGGFMR